MIRRAIAAERADVPQKDNKPEAAESSEDKHRPEPNFDYSSGAAALRGEVYRPPEYLEYLEKATVAMRTIRLIVYAGMMGFLLLAVYGFILIYRLTTDVHAMVAQSQVMTQQMQAMTRSMANMNQSVSEMAGDMSSMNGTMTNMNGNIVRMSQDVQRMGAAVTLMQHSARNLDQSMSPVMNSFNSMMPFWPGGNSMAPPFAR